MNAGHFLDYEITQLYHTNSTILNNCSLPSHRNFAHKFGEFVKLLKELKIMKCLLKVKIIHKLVFFIFIYLQLYFSKSQKSCAHRTMLRKEN